MTKLQKLVKEHCENMRPGSSTPHTQEFRDAWECAVSFEAGFNAAQIELNRADEIILDIHSQITTFSKYTASRVYDWKDIRGEDGTPF